MIRTSLCAFTLTLCVTVQSVKAQSLYEHTLALPADLPADYTLCQANVVAAGTSTYVATMTHDSVDPLPDGGALATQHGDFEYRSWVATRDGARTLIVQTTARNLFNVEAGFCRMPDDPDTAGIDFVPVNAPLKGGSSLEEDRHGLYDSLAEISVEICGYDDPFPLVQPVQSAMDTVVMANLDTHIVFDSYDTSGDGTKAFIDYKMADHPESLQIFAEAAVAALADIGEFTYVPGDRTVKLKNCRKSGFWITVAEGDRILWEEEWNGPRMIATRQDAGNIFFTYAAGIQNVFFNIAGADAVGEYTIGPPPPPDSDIDPETVTYGMFHYRGRMPSPVIATSISGTYWLTAFESKNGISGHFRFTAQEEGATRKVWGGFHDLKLHGR